MRTIRIDTNVSACNGRPCDTAQKLVYLRLDIRTVDDENKLYGLGSGNWLADGKNHRVIPRPSGYDHLPGKDDNWIARDVEVNGWFIVDATIEEVYRLIHLYGWALKEDKERPGELLLGDT